MEPADGHSPGDAAGPPAAPPVDERQIPADDRASRWLRELGIGLVTGGAVSVAMDELAGRGSTSTGLVSIAVGALLVLVARRAADR